MKITGIKTYLLRSPLQHAFYSSQARFDERKSLLVEIETDSGVSGWGEGGQYGPSEPVRSLIQDVFRPILLGRDPEETEVLWYEMYNTTRDFGRKGHTIEALSGIDIALWDLKGKASGQSIATLLGGRFRNQVETYATGFYYAENDSLSEAVERCRAQASLFVEQGFKALKMKVGLLEPAVDLKRVEAVRNVIGSEMRLMVDANHAYTRSQARLVGRGLEANGVCWFEEPIIPEDYEGYRQLCSQLDVAIAAGECEYTQFGFHDLLSRGQVAIVQPDVCCCGGITALRKIITLAEAHGAQVIPHVWGSGVAIAAGLQVLAALPSFPYAAASKPFWNEPILEFDRQPNPLREEIVENKATMQDSKVSVSNSPGLGIEINRQGLTVFSNIEGAYHGNTIKN